MNVVVGFMNMNLKNPNYIPLAGQCQYILVKKLNWYFILIIFDLLGFL